MIETDEATVTMSGVDDPAFKFHSVCASAVCTNVPSCCIVVVGECSISAYKGSESDSVCLTATNT